MVGNSSAEGLTSPKNVIRVIILYMRKGMVEKTGSWRWTLSYLKNVTVKTISEQNILFITRE